jgi:hypothetical protein
MGALFPRSANTVVRLGALLLLATPLLVVGGLYVYSFSPLYTSQYSQVEQLIQFDHRHHVWDDGIDCRYCHRTVETSPYAGIPPTSICMTCHEQIWNKSPLLDEVRARYFSDRAIPWSRVHRLPDFVYFNHSIHVNKGIGCVSCHGRVDQMALVEQVAPLTMAWCLDCHRNPSSRLRPSEEITNMSWDPGPNRDQLASELTQKYQVSTRTNCTTCHR